jgi:hypothetical protein
MAQDDSCIIEFATAMKFKYQVGPLRAIPCRMKGVHPWNRSLEGMKGGWINHDKVHGIATQLVEHGWDPDEEGGCVIEETPGMTEIVDHSRQISEGAMLLPTFTKEMMCDMVYGTLDHGHQNYSCRCFFYGVNCKHKDGAGAISLYTVIQFWRRIIHQQGSQYRQHQIPFTRHKQ